MEELMTFGEAAEIEKLKEWNEAYRLGEPIVDDKTYDSLYQLTKKKHLNHPFFAKVGFLSEEFGKDVVLEYHMGSLRNCHYFEDKREKNYEKATDIEHYLEKHNNGSGWLMTDKIDGLSVLVTWEKGIVDHAELRGDGMVGTDCTDKIKIILKDIVIPYHRMVARGEISLRDPQAVGLKNRRNGAVGIMKRESLEHIDHLDIFFYELIECVDHVTLDLVTVDALPSTEKECIELIQNVGLGISRFQFISPVMPTSDIAKLLELSATNFVDDLYDADGKVICPNNYPREDSLLPDGKVAFKTQAEIVATIVTSIDIQVSRMGKLVPVVYYEPLELAGATCKKATGFNYQFINDNQIGVGSKILVCRTQEVIPYINGVVESKGFELPETCPVCNSGVHWDENGVHLICSNMTCPAQALKNITHYFISLGLEEYSESSFEKLGVKSIFDVYKLTSDDIEKIEGFGEKSAIDFVQRIQDTKKTKPELLIRALGMNLVGRTISKQLVRNFSWEKIRSADFTMCELTELPGISEKKATAVIEGLKEMSPVLGQLEVEGVVIEESTGPLEGLTFCVTGKLEKMTRSEIEMWVVENGGDIGGIKKIPNMYLVTNKESSSGKYQKAIEYAIPIITELELYQMVSD